MPLFFEQRDRVADQLQASGIHVGMHYKRNDLYPPFADCARMELEGAAWYADHELTLPLHPSLTDEDVETVIGKVASLTVST
jgi:dTDP-4-amino-4,6-dideoxygalactose transaminase